MVRQVFGHRDLLSEGAQASAIVLNAQGYDLRGDSGGYGRTRRLLDWAAWPGPSASSPTPRC